jgi:hypothetical protein
MARLATLFVDHWQEAQNNCNVTEEDVVLASDLGARILELMGATGAGDVCDAKEVRNLAAEYLRRGIEDIAAVAGFVFRNDPESLSRYPKLFAGKRKQGAKENGEETADETFDQPTAAPVAAPGIARESSQVHQLSA